MKKLLFIIIVLGLYFTNNTKFRNEATKIISYKEALAQDIGGIIKNTKNGIENNNLAHLKALLNNTPEAVQKEVTEFKDKIKKLQMEGQIAYDSLSQDAKNFLDAERNQKSRISGETLDKLKSVVK
jgi:hypothetical protein